MPTGYTAGIMDGELKTFKDFATLCMRAFGATVHMRDESLNTKWEARTPSDYHPKNIEKAKSLLLEAQTLTDEEVVQQRELQLMASRKYHVEAIERTNKNLQILKSMLQQAIDYEPPTTEHIGIKEFMIQQLRETIKFDGSTKYHEERLEIIYEDLNQLNPAIIRAHMIVTASKDIDYHEAEYLKELQRCEESNKWVETFLTSIL